MKLTIESTAGIAILDGIETRIWEGRTEKGIPCVVFVHRIAVRDDYDKSEFDALLLPKPVPAEVKGWPQNGSATNGPAIRAGNRSGSEGMK